MDQICTNISTVMSTTIGTSILTALIAAIVSNIFIWWHKEHDYKRDYYKKIIDKRMKAYEELQVFIWEFTTEKQMSDFDKGDSHDKGYPMFVCFDQISLLEDNINKLLQVHNGNMWFSKKARDSLHKLNEMLVGICTVVEYPSTNKPFIEEYNNDLKKYGNKALNISEETYNDKKLLLQLSGIANYAKLNSKATDIKASIVQDMYRLDDVKDFLKSNID